MFPTQESHLPRVRNVGTKFVRLFEAKQIQPSTFEVHSSYTSTSTHGVTEIKGWYFSLQITFVNSNASCLKLLGLGQLG